MDQDRYELGMRIRREVLGDDYVDQAMAARDGFNEEFQEMVTEYCWGGTWGRGVLSRQQRSILNLGMLAAGGKHPEFKIHFRAAIRNGLGLPELKEIVLQIAVYCGIPTGVECFRLARQVLAEMEEKGELPD